MESSSSASTGEQNSGHSAVWGLTPGIMLASTVTAAAFSVRHFPGLTIFSPMILAVMIGIMFANLVGLPGHARQGIAFCQRSLLRCGIVLLGFQLSVEQVLSIGWDGICIVLAALISTFYFTILLGQLLGVDRPLGVLIAAGTSICGVSAIVAANSVARANEEDLAYAVATITLFGTIAMLTFPLVAPAFGLDSKEFGLWAGASIHEVAQVVGASFQNGPEAGEIGTVAKLLRVAMLAPIVLVLSLVARRRSTETTVRPPIPWFVLAFAGVVAINSAVAIPSQAKEFAMLATTTLISLGLASVGLHTDVSKIRSRGLPPLLLALSASLFIAGLSLLLVKIAE